MTALYATTMALFHRERTGEGQEVEVAMFETMAAFMLVEHANGAMFDPPLAPAGYPRAVSPNRKPYRTKDGHISALVYNDKQWAAFIDAVNPAWAGEHFATLEQRARQIDTVYGLLAETFAERTTQEWLDLLRSLGHPGRAGAHAGRTVRQSAPRGGRVLRGRSIRPTGRCDFPDRRRGFPGRPVGSPDRLRDSAPTTMMSATSWTRRRRTT